MARREIKDARILLTGASSGIGQALAVRLAQSEAKLVITARRGERLDSLAARLHALGGECTTVVGDVTSPETRQQLVDAAGDRWGGLDVLINNAGIGAIGPFSSASSDRVRQIMEVNFFAPVELMRNALPLLRQGHHPLIVNVGSVLGHFSVPNKSEYCASKFALHGFSDALRCELLSEAIDVLLVSPSTTRSEFFDRLVEDQGGTAPSRLSISPETVARRTVLAMRKGRRELILPVTGKLLVALDRIAPSIFSRLLADFG